MAPRVGLGKKRKKSSWSSAVNNTFRLFYSLSLGTKCKFNYIEIGPYYWKTTYSSGTPYVRKVSTWMYLTLTLNRSCILESQTAGSLQLEEKSEIQAHMLLANCELITLFYLGMKCFKEKLDLPISSQFVFLVPRSPVTSFRITKDLRHFSFLTCGFFGKIITGDGPCINYSRWKS